MSSNTSARASSRVRDDRSDGELDEPFGAEAVLADRAVVGFHIELDRQASDCRRLGDANAHRHVPGVVRPRLQGITLPVWHDTHIVCV